MALKKCCNNGNFSNLKVLMHGIMIEASPTLVNSCWRLICLQGLLHALNILSGWAVSLPFPQSSIWLWSPALAPHSTLLLMRAVRGSRFKQVSPWHHVGHVDWIPSSQLWPWLEAIWGLWGLNQWTSAHPGYLSLCFQKKKKKIEKSLGNTPWELYTQHRRIQAGKSTKSSKHATTRVSVITLILCSKAFKENDKEQTLLFLSLSLETNPSEDPKPQPPEGTSKCKPLDSRI